MTALLTPVFLAKILNLHLTSFLLNIFTSTHHGFLTTSWLYSIMNSSIHISFDCVIHSDKFCPVSQERTRSRHWGQMTMMSIWKRSWSMDIYQFPLLVIYNCCSIWQSKNSIHIHWMRGYLHCSNKTLCSLPETAANETEMQVAVLERQLQFDA